MSALDLDAIEKRANAATTGPWSTYGAHGAFDVTADNRSVASMDARDNPCADSNCEFIAHAREDVLESNIPGAVVCTIDKLEVRVEPIFGDGPKRPPTKWFTTAYNHRSDRKAISWARTREECVAMAEPLLAVVRS